MKKKILSWLHIALFLFHAPTLAAAIGAQFSDVSDTHENFQAIEYLREQGIVQGYENGQFQADYTINRAEFVKIVAGSLPTFSQAKLDDCMKDKDLKNWTTVYFTDIPMDAWFAPYICVAKELRIVDGYPDGSFKPEQAVNFVEAAKIVANAQNLKVAAQSGSEDWFVRYVKSLEKEQDIPTSIRSFGKRITRGEMAELVYRIKEDSNSPSLTFAELTIRNDKEDELPQVDSCNALIDQLKLDQEYDDGIRYFGVEEDMAVGAPVPTATPTAPQDSGAGANRNTVQSESTKASDDFSTTNVQVKGVDEADIIKNDGKYIYLIRGKTVKIVEAFPGESMKELATIELDDEDFNPQEIYIDQNQMVIIGNVYRSRAYPSDPIPFSAEKRMMAPGFGIVPPDFGGSRMKVYLYSIANRSNPTRQRAIEIEGNYTSSRKVGKNVYFVLNQWIPFYHLSEDQPADTIIPMFRDSATTSNEDQPLTRCTGIQYFPGYTDRNYLIVAGLNIADLDGDLNRKVVLGSSQNIYASAENLYVASPHYKRGERRIGRDIVVENENGTMVYRFALNQDQIEYQNQGYVPGNILNQFSMDEHENHFRIATTRNEWRSGNSQQDNNLYILSNQTMTTVGEIEGIAPGESIKSVRFMGDRAYMVTFRNVDPLFVIDVASPSNPKILGKLKIPGWSDYLHPYDETHLIGFGREVDPKAEEADRITSEFLLGMKLSIFDVTDVANPKETFKEVIGDNGTSSELLYNHKALLFDREKGLLAFPITVHEIKDQKNSYGEPVFQGAYVYSVDLNKGFTLRGKVTHFEDNSAFQDGNFWSQQGRMIQRLLYIGQYLYSVSPDFVRSYDISTTASKSFLKLTGSRSDDVNYIQE